MTIFSRSIVTFYHQSCRHKYPLYGTRVVRVVNRLPFTFCTGDFSLACEDFGLECSAIHPCLRFIFFIFYFLNEDKLHSGLMMHERPLPVSCYFSPRFSTVTDKNQRKLQPTLPDFKMQKFQRLAHWPKTM